jgi:LuxR family maltose regulon positive regulatory protein
MTMTFTSWNEMDGFESVGPAGFYHSSAPNLSRETGETHIFAEKLAVPKNTGYMARPRLNQLLEKKFDETGAAMIAGRAGTGKTALAADVAHKYTTVVWYGLDAADARREVFLSYLRRAFQKSRVSSNEENFARSIEMLFADDADDTGGRRLIVLDDIHHLFDADWFGDFFAAMLGAIGPNTHLLLLSRGTPPLPLWRMRSKRSLAIIDENLLALDLNETNELCRDLAGGVVPADKFHRQSSGRIGKLRELIDGK